MNPINNSEARQIKSFIKTEKAAVKLQKEKKNAKKNAYRKNGLKKELKPIRKQFNKTVDQHLLDPYAERVALSIALPGDVSPLRYNTEYSVMPTMVCKPRRVVSPEWTSGATAAILPADTLILFAFRDVERANILSFKKVSCIYDFMINGWDGNTPTLLANIPSTFVTSLASGPKDLGYAKIAYGQYSEGSGTLVHDNIWFAGTCLEAQDGRFFWLDAGTVIQTRVKCTGATVTSGSYAFSVDFRKWSLGGIIKQSLGANTHVITASGTSSINYTVSESGYYAFFISAANNTVVGGSLTNFQFGAGYIVTDQDVMGHLPPASYVQNFGAVGATRVLGASMLYTNTASPLNRQGKIGGVQVPENGTHWSEIYSAVNPFNTLMLIPEAEKFEAANGCYGFLKPTQPGDFDFRSHVEVQAGLIVDSHYPIDDMSSAYIAMAVVIETTDGRDGEITFCHSQEYQTTDQYREPKTPNGSITMYKEGVSFIRHVPQWHENPLHLGDIWNTVKGGLRKVGGAIVKYGPAVLEGALKIAPMLLALA